jgi:phosphorylase kinase alpha/beta subunit
VVGCSVPDILQLDTEKITPSALEFCIEETKLQKAILARKVKDVPGEGLLQYLISDEYTLEGLARVKETLAERRTHEIFPVAHGLFAASPSQARDSATGYQNVWVRDNVMVANSFRLRGQLQPAVACMQGLAQFFEKQAPRFREIIGDPVRVMKEDANRRPHIRFHAETLDELPEKWPHAQNDALGHALWFRFVLAKTGVLPLTPEDSELYRLFPEYFEAVEYWQDHDSGAWEEERKINNSSVGAVVAGLEEMRRYQTPSSGSAPSSVVSIATAHAEKLDHLIAKGRERLDGTLPFESPPERLVDSALLFLIHPLGVVRERSKQDAILKVVQARLKGEIGIKRYAGDSYFCQDYDEWFPADQQSSDFAERLDYRDAFLQPNCEAQWCIFDPLLSVIYGERFLADPTDTRSFRKQVHYFNRSLRQVTADGLCPELYFLKDGRYVPNAHTPLAWTQANQALALHLLEKSVEASRTFGPHTW